MTAYTKQAKTLVKKDSGWKLKADDSDCWALKIIVSRQQRTTAAMWLQTSLFTLKTLFPQKTNKKKPDHRELHKANIHKRAATVKILISDTKMNFNLCPHQTCHLTWALSKWMLHTGGGWGEPPPHDCKVLWVYNNTQKALYKCIIHSFIIKPLWAVLERELRSRFSSSTSLK